MKGENICGLVKSSKRATIWGWVVFIAGIFSLLLPLAFEIAISTMIGGLLAVAGIARLMDALQGGGIWSGLFGAISIVAGLVIMGHPLLGLSTLIVVLVVFFLTIGISGLIAAFQIRPLRGKGFLLSGGLISIVLAIMIWNQWPLSGRWAVGIFVGVQLDIFRHDDYCAWLNERPRKTLNYETPAERFGQCVASTS